MGDNISRINEFSRQIDGMLNVFYGTIDKIISPRENGNIEIARVIRRNFEESYHQFSADIKRMAESIAEQSKNNADVSIGTIDFSDEVNRVLNGAIMRSRSNLIPGNFKEAMNFDILNDSFETLKKPLSERMNNDYQKAINTLLSRDKDKEDKHNSIEHSSEYSSEKTKKPLPDNPFELPDSYKQKVVEVGKKPLEPKKEDQDKEKDFEPLPSDFII